MLEDVWVKTEKVVGENRNHKVLLYALSTCVWCKKTKNFLKDKNIEYEYIDVDLCNEKDQENIRRTIIEKGGRLSFPTVIIDDEIVITGFHEDEMKKALKI